MIYYDWMSEGWSDSNDEDFFVDMTPEGSSNNPEMDQRFQTQEDFFQWYRKGFESHSSFEEWFANRKNWYKSI